MVEKPSVPRVQNWAYPSRRKLLSTMTMGGAALAGACALAKAKPTVASGMNAKTRSRGAGISNQVDSATPSNNSLATLGAHTPKPLNFVPSQLKGISQSLIESHHKNNYGGAVRNLNRCEQEIAKLTESSPGFIVSALHHRELMFRNSKTLHEAYFDNLGGDGNRSGSIESALASSFGSSSTWEQGFRSIGKSLGGGSGWVILVYDFTTQRLRNVALADHTQMQVGAIPILVMDMYEHSYHMDFGTNVPRYLDAFFHNIQWEQVNARWERAQKIVSL